MQTTTLTGETVTLVVPFQFGFIRTRTHNLIPLFQVFVKAIGHDQWWHVDRFEPGQAPVLLFKLVDLDKINQLNKEAQRNA